MSFRFGALALFCALALPIPAMADWSLKPASSLQKLTASAPGVLEKFTPTPVLLRAARGEWEHFQVVVSAGDKPIEKLEIQPTGMATALGEFIPPSALEFYRENYVYIPRPSGNRRLEKLWWPDALIPRQLASTRVEANQAAVFWVTIKVPTDAAPGDYFGELDVLADGQPRRLALTLTVEPVTLPKLSMRGTVAVYYDVLRDWYAKNAGKTFTDAEWAIQKKRYYDFLLNYGINAYDLPVPWGTPEAAAYLKDPRVHSVRVPPLANGDFQTALNQLKSTGTLKKAYYYHIDEPQPDRYAAVKEATAKLRPLGIKHLVTAHPNESLKNQVDIWCPNVGDFFGIKSLDFKTLAVERKKGRETWWYTMVEPRYPYPTWLVDDEAASVRSYGQTMAKFGITGFVYSMAHGWGPKPLDDITSYANTSGDGTLIYPAELVGGEGPMPSLRLMLLRDAMEDYELLRRVDYIDLSKRSTTNHTAALNELAKAKGALPQPNNPQPQHFNTLMPPQFPFQEIEEIGGLVPIPPPAEIEVPSLQILKPVIDGQLNDRGWAQSRGQLQNFSRQRDSDTGKYPATRVWFGMHNSVLYVAVRSNQAQTGEWVAVDIAPTDIQQRPERLRFVVTQRGTAVVERHTRDGHFQVEVPGFKSAVKVEPTFWNTEFAIPLEPLGYGNEVRFNVRRRTAVNGVKLTISAVPDGENPLLMPVVEIRQ